MGAVIFFDFQEIDRYRKMIGFPKVPPSCTPLEFIHTLSLVVAFKLDMSLVYITLNSRVQFL